MKLPFHQKSRRLAYGLAAVLSAAAFTAPTVLGGMASAVAQVTARSIELSSSSNAASNATTTYHVAFTTATTGAIQGIVVDFCSTSPIIGDSTACAKPTGFTVGASPTFANLSGTSPTTGWTATSGNTGRTFELQNASAGSVTAPQAISFDITNVQNPTTACSSGTACTFYARILTYATTASIPAFASIDTAPGSYVDYGGIALSTATPFTITAKVMESLSFCVYASSCGDVPDFTIGHGTPAVLTSGAVDTGTVKFDLSTNAQNGVDLRIKGDTLKSGTNSIPAVGATASTITAGTANFGMRVSTAGTNVSCTSYTTYCGGSGSQYGYNTTNTLTTYGDQFAKMSGATNASTSTLTFAATAAATTPAGVYTTSQQLIATGNF